MKVVIVVDTFQSGLGISSRQFKDIDGITVLAALDFRTPRKLLQALHSAEADLIIFTWRRLLLDLISTRRYSRPMNVLRNSAWVYFVVADHLGLNQKFLEEERKIFDFSHGYFTTNNELFLEYKIRLPSNPPLGIYRDLPDLELISKVRQEFVKKEDNSVIWVGNSSWGSRYGFIDHKGYETIVLPLKEKLRTSNPDIVFREIDLADGYISNLEVLRQIAKSKILILASMSEGTGLPILESLALGTVPITTNVGIARDVLKGSLHSNIVSRDVEDFYKRVRTVLDLDVDESGLIREFEDYATQKRLNFSSFKFSGILRETEISFRSFNAFPIKWSIRFLLRSTQSLFSSFRKRIDQRKISDN